MPDPASSDRHVRLWQDLGRIAAAHVVMLRDQGIIDDAVLAAVLTPLDGVVRGAPSGRIVDDLISAFEERLDALVPAGVVGAATIGRGRADTGSALLRLTLRRELLALHASADAVRRALIDLAAEHAATPMAAYAGGQPVQPTTFGHVLGATIGPLGRALAAVAAAYAIVNRSPLGAVALAATGFPISRERTAALLGFDGLIENTFDAVAATDHVAATAQAAAAVAAPLGRFIDDLLTWLRTDTDAFRLADGWVTGDPGLPQVRRPSGLERLAASAHHAQSAAREAQEQSGSTALAPLGPELDGLHSATLRALTEATNCGDGVSHLLDGGLEVNRAFLANRAGRAFTTGSDLAAFLMIEEGLDPASAANIASLTIARAREEGVEISGVTPQMIDAAALLIIGRELGVEVETISRYVAPRRFLERRIVPGGPAPAAVRAFLETERSRADADTRWREETTGRIGTAERELRRLVDEALAEIR